MNPPPVMLIVLLALAITVGVVSLFVGIIWMIGMVSGWRQIAAAYPLSPMRPFSGQRWSMQSARFGGLANYNNCLTFGADAAGLLIRPAAIFRMGHPPIHVPWNELTLVPLGRGLLSRAEIRFTRKDLPTITISRRLADRIAAAVGVTLDDDRQDDSET